LKPGRAALQGLAVALARDPDVIRFARALASRAADGRLARLAVLLTFVGELIENRAQVAAHLRRPSESRNGVDLMLAALGLHRGPAVVMAALLMALGERARLECTRELAFVEVELSAADLARVPPFAGLHLRRGRYFLPLDPRRARTPLGFLARPVREVLARRRALAALRRSAA
jgi:hypothetical protein